ncbi:MAG TPA: outer membrane beta-barrel protein [Crocinitomicaceae bacterium]|nr:outer membrane beta-barrel protein [Crocinitomicaceae bacterium]
MKKITLVCAMVLASMGAKAQGFYLDFNAGYGFGMPGNVLGVKSHTDIVEGVRYNTSSNLMGSIGNGLNLQLTPGYMITDNIGVELGINYFIGSKTTMAESEVTLTEASSNLDHAAFSSRKDVANSNQLRIAPAVLLSTGASKQVSGYAKMGIIMPLMGGTTVNTNALNGTISNGVITQETVVAKTEVNGAPSFGFRGALGINYNITDNLSVFGEVFAMSLNVKQKSRKTVSYKLDGQEIVETLPKYSSSFDYVDEVTPESNNADAIITGGWAEDHDVAKPKQELFAKTSFSQMGFQFGIKYTFSKKKIRTISGTPDF